MRCTSISHVYVGNSWVTFDHIDNVLIHRIIRFDYAYMKKAIISYCVFLVMSKKRLAQ